MYYENKKTIKDGLFIDASGMTGISDFCYVKLQQNIKRYVYHL